MANNNRPSILNIENAKIIFRNFKGEDTKFSKGLRSFSVVIDDPQKAQQLLDDGWNVKILKPREEDDIPTHHIQVAVSFEHVPPKIFMITGSSGRKKKTLLDEESVAALDYADISNADVSITPYSWEVNGKSGVKAYLKTLYVTIEEDEFASKYDFDGQNNDDLPF